MLMKQDKNDLNDLMLFDNESVEENREKLTIEDKISEELQHSGKKYQSLEMEEEYV